LEVMATRENICKCLHLPVQAGNNRVLESMNRRYTREKYLSIIDVARGLMPEIALTTDIIQLIIPAIWKTLLTEQTTRTAERIF